MKCLAICTASLALMLSISCTSTKPAPSSSLGSVSPVVTPRVTFSTAMVRVTPLPNRSALLGKVVVASLSTKAPLSNTVVRLARVYWNADKSEGAVVLDGAASPGAITNEEGEFFFSDIEPTDYAVVVGNAEASSLTVSKPDGKAQVFAASSGQILDAGTLELPRAP